MKDASSFMTNELNISSIGGIGASRSISTEENTQVLTFRARQQASKQGAG